MIFEHKRLVLCQTVALFSVFVVMFISMPLGIVLFILNLFYSGVRPSLVSIISSGIISFSAYLTPIVGDTLNYSLAYDNVKLGINDFGIEVMLYYLSSIAQFLYIDFKLFIVTLNFFVILAFFYFMSKQENIGFPEYIVVIVFLLSPFFISNVVYLVRTYIGLIFFIFSAYSKSKIRMSFFLLLSVLSQTFYLLTVFSFMKVFQRLLLSPKTLIAFLIVFFVSKSGVAINLIDFVQTISIKIIALGSSDLNRKINVLEHGVHHLGVMDYHRFILVIICIIYLSWNGYMEKMSAGEKIILSTFSFTTILALSFDVNVITLTRLGFLSFFNFILVFVIFWNYSKELNIYSIILYSYCVLVLLYSFVNNDFLQVSERVVGQSDYLFTGLFHYLG